MNAALSIRYINPELILLTFAFTILALGLFLKKPILSGIFCLAGILLAWLYLPKSFLVPAPIFSNLLVNDLFSRFFRVIALAIAFMVILISLGYKIIDREERGEFYFLLLVTTAAMSLAVSANNFIVIYVTLETISIISYILVGFLKRNTLSGEAGLKYFLFGTLATGIMLYGVSFIYGLFGTTDISLIQAALARGGVNNLCLSLALLLIFSGIAFKCALFPFHMWAPDVYQGAPTPITAFISVGPKAVGFVVFLRVFLNNFSPILPAWAGLFTLVSIATMTVGNIIALSQNNIKRMLAYSSIAQAGYIVIGIVAGSALGIKAVLFYLLAYVVMNLGAFGCVVLISGYLNSDSLDDYSGLSKRDPVSAFMLAMFLLSLAGIPPLAGFLGKFFLFAAAIQSRLILLAIAAAINSVVAFYYYVRVIKYMYLDEPKDSGVQAKSIALQAALAIALMGILILGVWPQPFLRWLS